MNEVFEIYGSIIKVLYRFNKYKMSWVLFSLSFCIPVENAFSQIADIDEVKAAFVKNFIGFTDWSNAVENNQSLNVCTTLESPLSGKLERLNGTKVRGYNINNQFFMPISELKSCNVLFISSNNENDLDDIMRAISGSSVLTISDSTSALVREAVMINLMVYSGKIRFNINLDTVREADLDLSSQLLNLAQEVRR